MRKGEGRRVGRKDGENVEGWEGEVLEGSEGEREGEWMRVGKKGSDGASEREEREMGGMTKPMNE